MEKRRSMNSAKKCEETYTDVKILHIIKKKTTLVDFFYEY